MLSSTSKQIETKSETTKLNLTLISVPFMGHFKILMKLALQLITQNSDLKLKFIITGWKNIQLNPQDVKEMKEAGIDVIQISDDDDIQNSAPMKFTFPRVVKLTDSVINICKNSDYIIYDFFSPEGYIAGKKLNIPTFCSVPAIMGPFDKSHALFQQGLDENAEYFKWIFNKYQINLTQNLEMVSDGFFIPSQYQNIIWTWPGLLQEEKSISSYTHQRKFKDTYFFMRLEPEKSILCDNLVQKAKELHQQGKKIIYVSLGTVVTQNLWNHESAVKNFVIEIFSILMKQYANHAKYHVIISTGRPIEDISLFKTIPNNFHIYQSVPQAALLNEVDLFITHAGGNSVNEAIDAGTPMIAIPFFGDQHICAEYITHKKVGISFLHEEKSREKAINTQSKLFFRHSLSEDTLSKAIETILHDKTYKKNIDILKKKNPINAELFHRVLKNRKILDWREGDLLYGCTPDRNKLAELTLLQHHFKLGDMRGFSQLFPNAEGRDILPRIIDQFHDVLTRPETYQMELKQSNSSIYQKTLQEYESFLKSNSHYLQPIGDLKQITPDKGRAYLETLWNMCLGGLEFFTTIKRHTIHFVVGMFNNLYNEAAVRELDWIRQHWKNDLVRQHVKFYIINNGYIQQANPVSMDWFAKVRPTSALIDVLPEKMNVNQTQWNSFKQELQQKAQIINPHLFFNHLKPLYHQEVKTFHESKLSVIPVKTHPELAKEALQTGDVYIYALLPKDGLRIMKKTQNEFKISHAALAENKNVICAGEVRMRTILVNEKKQRALDISNDSGHYMPDMKGLPQVIKIFENLKLPIYRVTGVHPKVIDSIDRVSQNLQVSLSYSKMI